MFRVRDADNGWWVVKHDDGELSPTAKHKKDATVFEDSHWLEYWQAHQGTEIVPLAEDEILSRLAQTGLSFEKPKKYNVRSGEMWVYSVSSLGLVLDIKYSARQSEAKTFTEIPAWASEKQGFEVVEVLDRFGLEGTVTPLRLEGFW